MNVKGFRDTIEWYNKNANTYSKSIKNIPAAGIEEFVNRLPAGASVLDAGCASGRDSRRLAGYHMNVTGLDISAELLKIAKEENPDIGFVEGNFLALPFEDASFNGVWAHASLVHLERIDDVRKALQEFNRVLKKGGILHVSVKKQTTGKKFDVVTDKLSGHNRFFQYFTKDEIGNYLKESGFVLIKIEELNDAAGRNDIEWIVCLARK